MIQLLWLLALSFHQIFIVNSQSNIGCHEGFTRYEPDDTRICLMFFPQMKSQLEATCKNLGGTGLFNRKMSDNMFKKFQEDLKNIAKTTSEVNAFIGMKKEQNDSDSSKNKWTYTNEEGSVDQKDYVFWEMDPRSDEDCGVMKAASDFKVTPFKCSQSAIALCEKSERPCFHPQMLYAEYYGRCISPSANKADYRMVGNLCYDGYIVPIKDESTRESAAAALHTAPATIYAGLHKVDGKWVYESGEEEEDGNFAGGKPGEMECGVYGLSKDGKLEIFTASCEGNLRAICELKD